MEFLPVVYEHAARFVGRRPWEVSRDADLLHRAQAAAYREYGHSPLVVGVDVYTVECEAYGGELRDSGGNEVPAAVPLLPGAAAIRGLSRYSVRRNGRFPLILDAARRLRREFSDARISVPLSGPFSIAAGLVGLQDLLLELMTEPGPVADGLHWLAEGQAAAAAEIAAEGFEVLFFESGSAPPLVSPPLFREHLLPALRSVLRPGRGGAVPPLIMGGDTVRILPELLTTGTGYLICPMETDRERFMASVRNRPGVTVRMNLTPGIFVGEDRERVFEEIRTAIRIAGGRSNTLLSTGVLPYDANPALVRCAREFAALQG